MLFIDPKPYIAENNVALHLQRTNLSTQNNVVTMADTSELQQLRHAYNEENLTKISSQLLTWFQNGWYSKIRSFLDQIGETTSNSATPRQLLAKCMMLYHPDRLSSYQNILANKYDNHQPFFADIGHIMRALQVLQTSADHENMQEEIFDSDQGISVWESDHDQRGSMSGQEFEEQFYSDWRDRSFYTVLKRDLYGVENYHLPYLLLQDIDEIELSGRGMTNLDGIEHCQQLIRLDVSINGLTNLDGLEGLVLLEELYAADNSIGYIDSLSNLEALRILDLSENNIDDIFSILNLPNLEFVNLKGNNIPRAQIDQLRDKPCTVIF